jgi:hypothetical protein
MIIGLMIPGPAAASERLLATAPYPAHLLVKRCKLFWSDDSEMPINMISVNGGATVPLVGKIWQPKSVIFQDQCIYWVDQRPNPLTQYAYWMLKKTSLDGRSMVTLAADSGYAGNILFHNGYIYVFQLSTTYPITLSLKKISPTGESVTLYSRDYNYYFIPSLAKDAAFLYWYEGTDVVPAFIKKIPLEGGTVTAVSESPLSISSNLIVDGGDIIFASQGYPNFYQILKVPVSGGLATELANLPRGQDDWVTKIILSGTNLYYNLRGSIRYIPKWGGTDTILIQGLEQNGWVTLNDFAVNDSKLFWSERTSGSAAGFIRALPLAGGAVETLIQTDDAPRELHLQGSDIYWTENERIAKQPLAGGAATTVAAGIAADEYGWYAEKSPPFTTDGTNLFVGQKYKIKHFAFGREPKVLVNLSEGKLGDLTTDGFYVYYLDNLLSKVFKVPVTGGTSILLSGQDTGHLATIRVHQGYVYWLTDGDEFTKYTTIKKVSTNGGQIFTVASDLLYLNDFVVDGGFIYFTDRGFIKKISVNGGAITTLVYINDQAFPRSLAIFNSEVYWLDRWTLGKIPTSGGTPTYIKGVSEDQFFPGSIAVDRTGLFWTEAPTGTMVIGVIKKYPDKDTYCVPYPNITPALDLLLLN